MLSLGPYLCMYTQDTVFHTQFQVVCRSLRVHLQNQVKKSQVQTVILKTGAVLKVWEEILLVPRNQSYKSPVRQLKVSCHRPIGLITAPKSWFGFALVFSEILTEKHFKIIIVLNYPIMGPILKKKLDWTNST